ncbi:DUF4395 domain-containing protein [Nitrosophilus kaiyonis]|uniref:DUF4395 domain-containing protein n=1 Tax=Nitrosophilus kaiyonis TaxID=2930200 RepID=UPI00248F7AE7|nr:DUF4395 domain-containing protein [Nitrosophilus kaiyonis]
MNQSCPVSFSKVDSIKVRISAFIYSFLIIYFFIFQNALFLALILLDLVLKNIDKRYAPIFIVSSTISKILNLKPIYEDNAPKKFASKIGIVIILLSLIFYKLDKNISDLLILIFLICAFLEAVFSYCVGCKMYSIFNYFQKKFYQ